MSNETIMLARVMKRKLIDPNAMYDISEKLDGQPVFCRSVKEGNDNTDFLMTVSRQGKIIQSIDHICEELDYVLAPNESIVGELYIRGQGSAEISGHVRRNELCTALHLYVFPEFSKHFDNERMSDAAVNITVLPSVRVHGSVLLGLVDGDDTIRIPDAFHKLVADCRINANTSKFFEGYIARKIGTPWEAGKRSNDYLKIIEEPTMDMKVVGLEEAVSKDKEPLGRVGAFIVEWVDENGELTTTKVSKGKLTNNEATMIWDMYMDTGNPAVQGAIIEVKYKRDAKYTVPRQPTFQRFRHDKDTYENKFPKD